MGQPAAYQGLTTDCILSICTYSILVLYCSDQYAREPGELLKCQVSQPHYVGVRIPPPGRRGSFGGTPRSLLYSIWNMQREPCKNG